MGALGGGAVAEPGGEGNAESKFWGDGPHVENDGAESSRLEEEIGGAESLVKARVRFARMRRRAPGSRLRARGSRDSSWKFRVWRVRVPVRHASDRR